MDTAYASKKNLNVEGTHSNISSIPTRLWEILFIESNDAYRNLLRQRILEGLKIGKGADSVAGSPFAPYDSHHPVFLNTLSELSKPDENSLKIAKSNEHGQTIENSQRTTNR